MVGARTLKWMAIAGIAMLAILPTSTVFAQADDAADAVAEQVDDAAAAAGAAVESAEEQVPTPPPAEQGSGLISLFRQGGNFMWGLLACSVVALAVILERLYSFQRARTNTRELMAAILTDVRNGNLEGAMDVCNRTRGPIASIVAAGILKVDRGKEAIKEAIESSGAIELSMLQRGLIVLASITNIAPLIGFLGTVSGMISAFAAIAQAEQVSAKLVAKGIQEALITTATGLVVAIPVQVFHSYFVSRVDRYVVEMEEAAVDLVDALAERGLVN